MSEIISAIVLMIGDRSFTAEWITLVVERLSSFGYTVTTSDEGMIAFSIGKVENHIKNNCNISRIPDGLLHVAVDNVCGEFLNAKKSTGQLEMSGFDFGGAIKTISEGDTSVTFVDGQSDEEMFSKLVGFLLRGESDLVCYRQLKW